MGMRADVLLSDQPFESVQSAAYRLQQAAVEQIASHGACVLVGRCADRILRDGDVPVLSTFVTASLDERIRRVSARDKMTPRQAEQKIRCADREHAAYYNSLSDAGWGVAENYNLCIDTGLFDIDTAADMVAAAARGMQVPAAGQKA